MPHESQDMSPVFRIDVSQNASENPVSQPVNLQAEMVTLLHQMVEGQDRQNELLEEMVEQMGACQRQRTNELTQWKDANPLLARSCLLYTSPSPRDRG